MFDGSLAAPADLVGVSDAALIGAIAGWARASAAAEATSLQPSPSWSVVAAVNANIRNGRVTTSMRPRRRCRAR